MTPVERAARAVCEAAGDEPDRMRGYNPMDPRDPSPAWVEYLPEAQAALSAVRYDELLAAAQILQMAHKHGPFEDMFKPLFDVLSKIDAEAKDAG